ncbi:hypothetical protein RD792_005743 [Penstemon davidsonii]|uniref:Uncharacterized protein n=1 Tax=Penstemon davidsonii TaxID=160366 RepID=A0ABR0DEE1_9LAMI|nr:hypothetical protein RD792_005743 [Penstemon davidsonii]
MPGLKLTNLFFFHSHKPYKFLNNLSSSAAAAASTTVELRTTILRLNSSAAWWRMTTPYAPAAYPKIKPPIIRGPKSHGFITGSGSEGQNVQSDRNLDTKVNTRMRATANGEVEYQSDVSPPQKLLTLPTILTIGRVASVPILAHGVCTFCSLFHIGNGIDEIDSILSPLIAFYVESWWGPTATTGIFIAAAFTDWLDGYLARKMNLGTPFGAFLDPVADKLMVAATLILLCTKPFEAGVFGQAQWLLTVPTVAIIGREITMSAVREWAASQDRKLLEAVAVNNLGKWKTATQMIALTILLASRDSSFVGGESLVSSGVVLLYVSAWLALWSLVVYVRKISKVLLR